MRAGRANRGYNPKYDSNTYVVDANNAPITGAFNLNGASVLANSAGFKENHQQSFMQVSEI